MGVVACIEVFVEVGVSSGVEEVACIEASLEEEVSSVEEVHTVAEVLVQQGLQ